MELMVDMYLFKQICTVVRLLSEISPYIMFTFSC